MLGEITAREIRMKGQSPERPVHARSAAFHDPWLNAIQVASRSFHEMAGYRRKHRELH